MFVAEHHFSDDAFMPSGLPFCAAAAARTERISVGTAVLLAPLYHPLRLAEDAASVDLMSQGRFILGLGLGYVPAEYDALGIPMQGRGRRLEETVRTLRRAWAGELVGGADRSSTKGVVVNPQPSAAGRPPVWIGGQNEAAVRRAGRLGDAFVATYVADPAALAVQAAWARSAAEAAGRDADRLGIAVSVPVFAWESGDAWERIRQNYYYSCWKYEDLLRPRDRRGGPLAPPPLSPEREGEIRRDIVVGSAEEVADRVGALNEAVGGDLYFVARLVFPGLDPAVQEEALWTFASGVANALR